MATWRPSTLVAGAFALALALLVFDGVISYRNTQQLIEHSDLETHSRRTLASLEALRRYLTDAETSQRGFVLTGEERFLEPYKTAVKEIPKELTNLRNLKADDPQHQQRLNELDTLITQKMSGFSERIELRRRKGMEAARIAILTGRGEKLMQEFRSVVREMRSEENESLIAREADSRASARAATTTSIASAVVAIILMLGVFVLLSREVRQRVLVETALRSSEEEVRMLNVELEQRVIERTAQLEAANKELKAFTYSVSHDLRSPLRHVDGFSKILMEEFQTQLDPQAQRYLERIRNGTQQMGHLVDDLLNLARVGRRELTLQVSGLNSFVQEVLSDLKPETANRQIEWQIDTLPFVECDPALMKQVFTNLLSNAVKFTRVRERAVIHVASTLENGHSAVFVRDNGVGFNLKYADKLFGVFQRLHRTEDFEGTGVGLATVQRIIHKHGGKVWADGELDKGATFYFSLGSQESIPSKATAARGG